jgi:hypothetical protein
MSAKVSIPPYGQRNNWVPRRAEVTFLFFFSSQLIIMISKLIGFR